GKVARFEVPEGTTPEQAQAMVEKEFPNLVPGEKRKSTPLERLVTGEPTPMDERPMAERLGRQAGLTARYGVEGLTAIPNMVGDAFGLNSSEAVSNFLTKMGLPVPEGSQE